MIGCERRADVVIVGGGPAGLAAGESARLHGADKVLILERDGCAGGILNQCIHNGFGLHTFNEELTGPEYAARYLERAEKAGVEILTDTMVMDISSDKTVTAMNRTDGVFQIKAGAVILAMGCRERPRGALNIPGYRPAGIFSAGTAQRLINMEGLMPGRKVVILGSGDIGLIMARRMTLEGARVQVVAEIMPYSGGLKRNIVQCLDDFGIPLKLSHTVTNITGKKRVESVTISQVDEHMKPIPGTEEVYECDTLLLSVGLLPENELTRAAGIELSPVTGGAMVDECLSTSIPGIYACGNVLHVHDLVDFVSGEAAEAGRYAAEFVLNGEKTGAGSLLDVQTEGGVRYTVPERIHPSEIREDLTIRFRVGRVIKNAYICVYLDDRRVFRRKKQILTPGEMESVSIAQKEFEQAPSHIRVTIEEA